jgi:hypothetical protein
MEHFHYARHFRLLTVGVAVLFLFNRWDLFNDPLLATFGLSGAIHACALVLSLRTPQTWLRKCLFIAIGAALSVFTLYVGIAGLVLFAVVPGNERLYMVLGLCELSGAMTYGTLIRLFWMAKFSSRSILAMAVGCLAAAFIAFFVRSYWQFLEGWWFAATWWFAFSGGLWYFDARSARSRRAHMLGPHTDA